MPGDPVPISMDGWNTPYSCGSDDTRKRDSGHAVYLRKLVRCWCAVAHHHGTVSIDHLHGDFHHAIPADDLGKSVGGWIDQSGDWVF